MTDDAQRKTTGRKWLWLVLRVGGTAVGLAYVLYVADPAALLSVALSLPAYVAPLTLGVMIVGLLMGTIRWRLVLRAYGATKHPHLGRLFHLYLVGLFYNSFLPGGLGGDVVRGVVARESFGEAGLTRSLTVVFVERVLGLCGLLILAGTVLVFHPIRGFASGTLLGAVGLVGALSAIVGIAASRRFADALPSFLARFFSKLPPLEQPVGLLGGLGLSLAMQVLTAVMGFIVLDAVEPSINFVDALFVVPVATAAAFFPLSVGGAGAREAAFVVLCSLVLDMEAADAAASSLVLFAVQLTLGGVGGLLQLAAPLERTERS